MHPQFTIDIARVRLDCVQGENKLGSNLLARKALTDETEYFNFSITHLTVLFAALAVDQLVGWGM